ncbi:MAG: hypothetical protein JW801_09585 [Bacteroidales bacterium]|nr:hypothetical protein [Bacteroidales bacterium]
MDQLSESIYPKQINRMISSIWDQDEGIFNMNLPVVLMLLKVTELKNAVELAKLDALTLKKQ